MSRLHQTNCLLLLIAAGCLGGEALAGEEVQFSRDVLPILSGKCFACHGPDEEERQADLRLDRRESPIGLQAIVPGKPEQSSLIERIFSTDPDQQMPPRDSGEALTDEQKATLKAWIEQGAEYRQHWAFVPPARPELPAVSHSGWCRNGIDNFVLARLEQEDLMPAPEADRYTLVRRLYLDLTGLLPSPEEADAFVNDSAPNAYENLVDGLLESPRYGERWARAWLDLARYSDTNGYEKDRPRSIWPYRDWVIRALNADMPFDQFTIEQIAGDMLPNATVEQKIATGFHRNTMLNEEGGIDPLEYRFYAMVDRVATTGTVWLGLTTGCAQCHTHKYDPITHTDYYSLMALLDNADEPDLSIPDPLVLKRREELEGQIQELIEALPEKFPPAAGEAPEQERRQQALDDAYAAYASVQLRRAVDWMPLRANSATSNLPKLESLEDKSIFASGDITKRDVFQLTFSLDGLGDAPLTALRLEAMADPRLPAGGPGMAFYEGRKGDFFLSEVNASVDGHQVAFKSGAASFGKISIGSGKAEASNLFDGDGSTGWSTSGREGESHHLVLNFAEPIPARGTLSLEMIFERHFAATLGRFRWSATSQQGEVTASGLPVSLEAELVTLRNSGKQMLDRDDTPQLFQQFLLTCDELKEARKEIDALKSQIPELPVTMVMQERPADHPRRTHRHHRGEFLQAEEAVSPAVPTVFTPLPEDAPANRLTFARWLVSERNPLVDRVQVDRTWAAFFGAPFVRSNGDYGTQSDPPTHPELLDWLATEFAARGRSMKALHKLIVMSATYRQSSVASPELLARDPENRLLARGPRLRIDAEMIRDVMLQASGLLSLKMYGPGVYPPQPASVTALAYGNAAWTESTGEDRYRRSLYTFSKRTAPFAAFTVFDAPSGETCQARRERSNTPLQALTLLNDEMYLEVARALAEDVLKNPSDDPAVLATRMFRRLLTRPPTEEELAELVVYTAKQRERIESGELSVKAITGNEAATPGLAAWTMTARVLMNLDEAITKE